MRLLRKPTMLTIRRNFVRLFPSLISLFTCCTTAEIPYRKKIERVVKIAQNDDYLSFMKECDLTADKGEYIFSELKLASVEFNSVATWLPGIQNEPKVRTGRFCTVLDFSNQGSRGFGLRRSKRFAVIFDTGPSPNLRITDIQYLGTFNPAASMGGLFAHKSYLPRIDSESACRELNQERLR